MKEQANQIRPGWVLQHNGKQYMVSRIFHEKEDSRLGFSNFMRDVLGGLQFCCQSCGHLR